MKLSRLNQEMRAFFADLYEGESKPLVLGEGSENARLALVGEAPGEQEALKALAGKGYTIGEAHGKLLAAEDMRIFPLYHPASVLYNPRLKEVYEQDLRALRALQDGN